jgi:general secretion pathway protein H
VKKSGTGNSRRTRRRDAGFSLLELILVLVVMSLVLAVAYPSMSRGRTAFHLRAVGRDVISSFRLARETAVTEQRVMQVSVDAQAQQVTVSDDVGDSARSFRLPDDVKIVGLSSNGEEVAQGPWAIRFLPNGSSDDGQVLLKADTGAHFKIAIDSLTGAARMVTEETVRTP